MFGNKEEKQSANWLHCDKENLKVVRVVVYSPKADEYDLSKWTDNYNEAYDKINELLGQGWKIVSTHVIDLTGIRFVEGYRIHYVLTKNYG